ncbi:Iodothyronine deiodinase [Aliiroseovarius halocynthiae]|uniref:Redoxin domain-containing protein n=1 Tax=Aliiroseovarius halocynthiae TaxID=985055 RepID=A0A545SU05_9RHOB|nr:redoxin domain-containing protein [Aliiroseovarius halocynthiae]TQV68449.1 redoxin domain-containing protein [Aliiroseovarius halocynthiae]SMR70845.1 Iodothyronine deiodinase [Aliiroseovarius halocynthiae]
MTNITDVSRMSGTSRDTYTYDTFTTGLILEDLRFKSTDPAPGDRVPDFDLEFINGARLRSDNLGGKPLLLVFGSRTCPVTVSARQPLADLHHKFGDRVRFVLVNTREAHPGEHIPQPKTSSQKREHATKLAAFMGAHFEVALDDINGTFHQAMGPKPNSAYILSPDGVILFRAHWANDTASLAPALQAAVDGTQLRSGKSRRLVRPLLNAIGFLPGVVRDGGGKVERDVWRAVPPFAVLGHLSRLFFFLPTRSRGPAVAITLAIAIIAAIWA